jgi:hypothetical protein
MRWSIVAATAAFPLAVVASPSPYRIVQAQQAPSFVGKIELVTIDVQITAARDAPLRELTTADFDITISGSKRQAASVTHLHDDDGKVTREPLASRNDQDASPACVFGFHRKIDRKTAHYVVAVDRTDADREEVKQVHVNLVDKNLTVQRYLWRTPIRRRSANRSPTPEPWNLGTPEPG